MTSFDQDLSALSNGQLIKLERQIARKHSGMFPWMMVIWAFGNAACWLALWPLVLFGIMPLWVAFAIAIITISLVYLPTHDAQHDIIGRPGTRFRWLNELVGHGTTWILTQPFEVLRVTHLEHHRHVNHPELDPDYTTHADNWWHAIWKSIRERQPGGGRGADYLTALERLGRKDLILLAIAFKLGHFAILFALAWTGYALEALLLWWLPLQIATVYINFYLAWAPHHPGNEQGRYRNTRSFKSIFGNLGSMGMQYHIIHHLYPYIPLDRTPAAYWEMRPILEARGARIEEL